MYKTLLIALCLLPVCSRAQPTAPSPYTWALGPSADPAFFPIAVWLQDPALAPRYKAAGFNTYVGLWKGPTEEQLQLLRQAGMKVICEQNAVGRRHLEDSLICGWMHGDEPDNAQPRPSGQGYGPPVPPTEIQRRYRALRDADPRRPVMLNLGQGVAWDGWYGRGERSGHPEDYPAYMAGGDIISFDIYPAAHGDSAVRDKLWYVARGVQRLRAWGGDRKIIWNCLECTRIGGAGKATPDQVRAEAWMSLIRGSQGLIYFVHQFKPRFNAAALLDDPPMLEAVSALNHQIIRLAPVLHSRAPQRPPRLEGDAPVAFTARRYKDSIYLFTVAMRDSSFSAGFQLPGAAPGATITAIGENRTLRLTGAGFRDGYGPWAVHLYRYAAAP